MTEERDPYAVLGIASSASPEEVTAAYRTQARRHHPDVSVQRDAEQRMAEINTAWGVLRDPAKRAAWDRAHGITPQVARRAMPPTGSASASPPRRASPRPPTAPSPGPPRASARPAGPAWRRGPAGEGAAGPPPGNPRGTVLPFGRHIGWSLGEIARIDPGYLVWLHGRKEGAPYREEIDRLLAAIRPKSAEPESSARKRRLFR
ncbi:MAG TPA: DnaJ domain-containing protein [Candidatus Limnocylindrales bacterium]